MHVFLKVILVMHIMCSQMCTILELIYVMNVMDVSIFNIMPNDLFFMDLI